MSFVSLMMEYSSDIIILFIFLALLFAAYRWLFLEGQKMARKVVEDDIQKQGNLDYLSA